MLQWTLGVHVSFSVMVFSGYMTSSGIAGSYGSFDPSFFLRNLHTVLCSGCINLHSHQQCKRVPFAQHPLDQLLFIYFLMMAIVTGMWWHLLVVWFAFLYNEWCWASFQVFFSHLYYLLWRNVYDFCPLLLGCLFFWYWATWATCKFWRLILCHLFCLLLFYLILRVVFSSCL